MAFEPDQDRFDYEQLEPLITRVDQDNEVLIFTFRCPVTGLELEAPIVPGEAELAPLKPTKSGFFSLLESLFGGDSDAPWEVSKYDRDDLEEAAEDAFRCVAANFIWENGRWIWWEANDRVILFHEMLEKADLSPPLHRRVLQRVLVETLQADGQVLQEELDLLAELTGEEGKGSFPFTPLEASELVEVSGKSTREAILMLGYAMACCDGEVAASEEERLEILADGLEIPRLRGWELRKAAQFYILDETFHRIYSGREPSALEREQVYQMAAGIGLDDAEAETIEFRYLKRREVSAP